MKRNIVIVSLFLFTWLAATILIAGKAEAGTLPPIVWGSSSVSFNVPVNGCGNQSDNGAKVEPECLWTLWVNEPNTGTFVGSQSGVWDVLTVAYPEGFCGKLQADVLLNGVFQKGDRHTTDNCTPPTTTTTTTSPPTTTTTAPPSTTTTTSTQPPVSTTTVPPSGGSSTTTTTQPLPVVGGAQPPTSGPPLSVTPTTPTSATGQQLPFTGTNIKPFLFVGIAMILLGIGLMSPATYKRAYAYIRR